MRQQQLFNALVAPHCHDSLHEELNPFARRNVNALWIEPSVGPGPAGGGGGLSVEKAAAEGVEGRHSPPVNRTFCAAPINTVRVSIPPTYPSLDHAFAVGPSTRALVTSRQSARLPEGVAD
eukprot:jgi/Tetstr1/431843/TSEL_021335.t1